MALAMRVPYWENCYSSCLVNLGFIQGVSSPCCFVHPEWKVMVVVHGDDFTAVGSPEALNQYEEGMQRSFDCKLKGRLGTDPDDCREMRVLNRIVRVTDKGLLYEADPRQAGKLVDEFGLGTTEGTSEIKSLSTPSIKVTSAQANSDKPLPQDFWPSRLILRLPL